MLMAIDKSQSDCIDNENIQRIFMVEMYFGFQLDFKLFDYDPEYIFGVLKIESNID